MKEQKAWTQTREALTVHELIPADGSWCLARCGGTAGYW